MTKSELIKQKIEELKQRASRGLEEMDLLSGDHSRPRWSVPDRKIAMKYLIAVKQGMDPRQWAQLHPAEWKRSRLRP
jgi:hypothetical protein